MSKEEASEGGEMCASELLSTFRLLFLFFDKFFLDKPFFN